MSLISNAEIVCTNSFHGTALSIKLGIPFYVLEEKNVKDERKRSILKQLDLEERIISSCDEVENIIDYHMNFNGINIKLNKLMESSSLYLKKALCIGAEE